MTAALFGQGFDAARSGPLYLQLSRRIADGIASGALVPGQHLPPERELARLTGLSRVTVRKAVASLVASGQLVQRRGSGTFVAPRVERLEQALSLLTSFSEDMARRGKTVRSVWLTRAVGAPTPEEMMALGLTSQDHVARLERVRLADEVPLAIERAALPAAILPDPLAVETSLYAVLARRGLRPVRAVQRISAANLGARDAGLLEVAVGVAGLRIERISYLAGGRVVEFVRSLYRGDAYDFAAELQISRRTGKGCAMTEPKTFMQAEVEDIPAATERFLTGSRAEVAAAAEALRTADPALMVTVARGSSDHAATYLKYAVELEALLPVASVGPSVASVYGRQLRMGRAGCVGISQSGQSPDIVEMMRSAGAGGALTVAITNFADSPMAAVCDHTLALRVGPEQSVAATKTFVVSVVAGLALLAEWRQDAELAAAVAALPAAFARALACDWSPLSNRLVTANSLYVLGRGPGFAIANEIALKFKETSGIHAESYSAAEVLHGPAALVQARFPVLALGVADAALPQVIATADRLAGQGADVFLTCEGAGPRVTCLPAAPGLHPLVAPLTLVVSFYVFIEALARRRGLNPDTPPHLRKVTETV